MAKGQWYASESQSIVDERTGAAIRQVTAALAINHQAFYYLPSYDDAMVAKEAGGLKGRDAACTGSRQGPG